MPRYPGISSEAFRHPLDREAEKALRSLPGFDLVARKFVEFLSERPQFVYHMGNSIQVGPRQYASVYRLFRECVASLDVTPEPALFISQNPFANAYALGQERPLLTLYSGLLDVMGETELRAVLAHELGHIKCGHTTLSQMAIWLLQTMMFVGQVTLGLSNLVLSSGLLLALYEWKRKSELSADRAALLATDDPEGVLQSMLRIAGGTVSHGHELSLAEFKRQAARYEELDRDNLNQVYKFFLYNNLGQGVFLSHPFVVERVKYLEEWATSAEYRDIQNGRYQRDDATGAVDTAAVDTAAAAERLRREIEALQKEIDRLKQKS